MASNLDLEEAVERGRFRPDLYFRLNVMSFHLPPLRERMQDIAPLARGMAARFNRKFNKDAVRHPSRDAWRRWKPFPGRATSASWKTSSSTPCWSAAARSCCSSICPRPSRKRPCPWRAAEDNTHESLHHQREIIERNVIQRALMTNGYSRTRAADSLGISRVTLYKKMKKYGLMKVVAPV